MRLGGGAILGPAAGWDFMAVAGSITLLFSWHKSCWGYWAGRIEGSGSQSLSVHTKKLTLPRSAEKGFPQLCL